MQLTARDVEMVRHVYRHRFLRSDQLARLVGGSHQQILRRLQLLYHHRYLDRPRSQIDYFQSGGSRRMVYGLGSRGAAMLSRIDGGSLPARDWSFKNCSVGRLFLEHALLTSEIMVDLECAARQSGRVRLLYEDELLAERPAKHARDRFQWKVQLGSRTSVGVAPDRVFALEYLGTDFRKERIYLFLEADRGTMPVARAGLTQSSFYRKLLAYEATWAQNTHRLRFEIHRFRVLTVTAGSERLQHLIKSAEGLERGRGLFLFADIGSLRDHADTLSFPWSTTKHGETAYLLN
jgi:hypothetical protein